MNNDIFLKLNYSKETQTQNLIDSLCDIVFPYKISFEDNKYCLFGYFASYEQKYSPKELFFEIIHHGFSRLVNSNTEFLLFLLNKHDQTLSVCVDQFLSFACYFSFFENSITFSTNFSYLKNEIGKQQKLKGDLDGLLTGLLWEWNMTERTLIKQIKLIPAGSNLLINLRNNKYHLKSLLDVDFFLNQSSNNPYTSLNDFARDWVNKVTEIVKTRWETLPKNYNIGCDISSGFDCTLIAYCLSQITSPSNFTCFSRYSDLVKEETNMEVVKKFIERHHLKLESVNATEPHLYESDLTNKWSIDDPYQVSLHGQQIFLKMLKNNDIRMGFTGQGGIMDPRNRTSG